MKYKNDGFSLDFTAPLVWIELLRSCSVLQFIQDVIRTTNQTLLALTSWRCTRFQVTHFNWLNMYRKGFHNRPLEMVVASSTTRWRHKRPARSTGEAKPRERVDSRVDVRTSATRRGRTVVRYFRRSRGNTSTQNPSGFSLSPTAGWRRGFARPSDAQDARPPSPRAAAVTVAVAVGDGDGDRDRDGDGNGDGEEGPADRLGRATVLPGARTHCLGTSSAREREIVKGRTAGRGARQRPAAQSRGTNADRPPRTLLIRFKAIWRTVCWY